MKSPTSKGAPAPSSLSGLPPDRLRRADLPAETHALARDLIGKLLVRRLDDGEQLAGRIVETEAYAPGDPASHAFRGPTRRNASMFLPHAHAYVYLIYGTSYCLNVVSEGGGEGAAVLIRAAEPLAGLARMRALRGRPELRDDELARGPGNLCRAFGIGPELDGLDLDTGALPEQDLPAGRFGGFRTAAASLVVEFCGLLLLWLAPAPAAAILGTTITGLGLSLIFPSFGVEALKLMPVSNRGAGIGVLGLVRKSESARGGGMTVRLGADCASNHGCAARTGFSARAAGGALSKTPKD